MITVQFGLYLDIVTFCWSVDLHSAQGDTEQKSQYDLNVTDGQGYTRLEIQIRY